MEFASRRARVLALAGLALLTAPGCRCSGREPPPAAAPREAGRSASALVLAGRVSDEHDRAVPGARVLTFGPTGDAAAAVPREARTDVDGGFGFGGLAPGRYMVLVEAVGLAALEPRSVDLPGPATVIRLEGQGRSLSGEVVSDGGPVRAARVRLGGGGRGLERETASDEAGRFVFHGLGPGAYALRATRGLLASPVATGASVDEGEAGGTGAPSRPVRLVLGPGLGLEGVVVDDGGHGLPGAEVRAEATPDDPLAESARTGPDGRFRLGPLPPGRLRLVARAAGFLLRAPVSVALDVKKALPPQRLELVRGASLGGRVVDARGAPVGDAQIRCGGAGGVDVADLAVIFDRLPLAAEAAATGGGAGRALGATKVARSDARGVFRLDALLPGPVHLTITRAPWAPLELDAAALEPGQHSDVGVVTLREPAPGDAGAPAPTPPARAGATLVGLATDSGNRPLARARVRAWPPGLSGAPAPGAAAFASALTDAGGHFTLTGVPDGPLLLELDHPSYPVTFAAATPGAAATLTAPIPGGVGGEVREHVTGASVPRASVEGVGPGGQTVTTSGGARKPDAATFRLLRLRPGHWTLTAKAPGYRAATRELDVPPSATVGETSVRGLRLELDVER
jgi:protocatechuate 3,4-dioxygenase beta subunit